MFLLFYLLQLDDNKTLMMKKILLTVLASINFISVYSQLINEIQVNPIGTDPDPMFLEIKGTSGSSFNGHFLSIDCDSGASFGFINDTAPVSGTFDAQGLLTVSVPDHENPSSTYVLCSLSPAEGFDIDMNNDGNIDNVTVFGTVFDAIGIADASGDVGLLFGDILGGSDFPFIDQGSPDEFRYVFRDGTSNELYGTSQDFDEVFDISGNQLDVGTFSASPFTPTFGSVNPSSGVVPVIYSSIDLTNEGSSNILSWATVSEVNNDYFDIEHSLDGENFTAIGRVGPKSNSRAESDYNFIHENPIQGVHYYRLKQVDLDGIYSHSEVKSVEVIKEGEVTIFPSMVQDRITIRHNFLNPAQVRIYNMSGQEMVSYDRVDIETTLDVSILTSNVYIVHVTSGAQQVTRKIVKQ